MEKILNNLKTYSPTVLRIGMAIIAIWFGAQELLHPQMWTSYIPDSVVSFSHLNANFLVHMNGAFEPIFGIALLLGIKTRISALLLTIHMFDITYVVGYGALGVRDLGLAFGLLAVFMHGPSPLSFDIFKKETPTISPVV
jgi:uncharacterized membrane protein YphA (DoxX/SURF4 family)